MSMFNYGKNKSGSEQVYKYQYLKPTLQAGFYPVDNLQEITPYESPVTSSYGVPVYGEISYSKPLTQDQCGSYEFLEMTTPSPIRIVAQQPNTTYEVDLSANDSVPFSDDVKTEENAVQVETKSSEKQGMVYLENVKPNRLFDSKNKDYKVISMRDAGSETGYTNFVVQTKNLSQNQDGTYNVVLGAAGSTQNLSFVKDGKSEFKTVSVEDIKKQYEQTLVTAEPKAKSAQNAFLNSVDTKFVCVTKNQDYKVVSIPYSESENGYAKVTVARTNIFDTKVNGKTVPNHVNVNLGPAENMVPVSIKKDGKFTQEFMSVRDLAELQKQAVESWKKYSMQKSEEIAQTAESNYQNSGSDMDTVYE